LNKMLYEIGSLGKEQTRMYEIEIAKDQMEISAFRNQINPHFLYNTLECVRAMALSGNRAMICSFPTIQ
ncbi:sensor histidine kinase, partial [Paenibacillus sp. TAF58]